MKLFDQILLTPFNIVVAAVGAVLLFVPGVASLAPFSALSGAVSRVVSTPDLYAQASSFPTEARSLVSLVLALLPFQVALTVRAWRRNHGDQRMAAEYRTYSAMRASIMAWAGWPLVVVAPTVGLFLVARDPGWCEGCVSDSKLGLLLLFTVAPPTLVGLVLAAAAFYRWRSHR